MSENRATLQIAALSGIEVSVLVRELSALCGSYVANVYSLGENQVLKLKKREEEEKSLIISPRYGAWLSNKLIEHSPTSYFTTALRREINRTRLEAVKQLGSDRVIAFYFSDRERTRKLILELMPPGNILVLDEVKVILLLRDVRSNRRTLVRGQEYSLPVQTRLPPESVNADALRRLFERERIVGRALGRGISLPRKYIDEILSRVSLEQDFPSPSVEDKIREIDGTIHSILDEIKHPYPCVVKREGMIEILSVKPHYGEMLKEGSMSELADETFSPLIVQESVAEKTKHREGKVKEYEASLSKLKQESEELEQRSIKVRDMAQRVQSGETNATTLGIISKEGLIPKEVLDGIKHDNQASIASRLFDYAKQLKSESGKIQEAAESLSKRMKKEIRIVSKEQVVKQRDTRKKNWYEKFRWFFTSEKKLAIGGRDAHSNSILIKRHLEEGDSVYHADLFGSPFFILKGGVQQTDAEVKEMACATVSFSSAWKTGLGAADAYWVYRDQVGQTAPSGEYLPKGSFMIRGKKNFVSNNLVQVSLGIDHESGILSGPEQAIKNRAIAFVTLIPHREKTSETAKKVLNELRKMAGEGIASSITIDDILRALPSGGGKIVRRGQGIGK
jgi:predicted ribosome quality control (RQC) complex YloA/Tae2 family protein